MSGKNVLVTGANGHVGYTLTKMLFEEDTMLEQV